MWEVLKRPLQIGSLAGRAAATLPAGVEAAPREPEGDVQVLGEALRVEVRRLFRGSFKLRHLDAQRFAQHLHLAVGLARGGLEPGGQRRGLSAGEAADLQRTLQRLPHGAVRSFTCPCRRSTG